MKRTLNLIFAILVMAIFPAVLSSCSSSELTELNSTSSEQSEADLIIIPADEQAAFDALAASIEVKASAFLASQGDSPQIFGFLKRIVEAAISDIAQGVVRLCQGDNLVKSLKSAGNSSVRSFSEDQIIVELSHSYNPQTPLISFIKNQQLIEDSYNRCIDDINQSSEALSEYNIGTWHNAVILDMLIDGWKIGDDSLSIATRIVGGVVRVNERIGNKISTGDASAKDILINVNSFFREIYDKDIHKMCAKMNKPGSKPRLEVNILEMYLDDYLQCNDISSIKQLTNIYREELAASSVSAGAKKIINSFLSIGVNSAELWNMILSELDDNTEVM